MIFLGIYIVLVELNIELQKGDRFKICPLFYFSRLYKLVSRLYKSKL
jgi:hypothetical protein